MKLFGRQVSLFRSKAPTSLSTPDSRGGIWPTIKESFSGAWQSGIEVKHDTVVAYNALFACATLIANDIGKMAFKLVQRTETGVWQETYSPAYSPVLRKPNSYQTAVQFREAWALSKVLRGNAYILKARDRRGAVVALHVLDPLRVTTLVTPSGEVYYQLQTDHLSNVEAQVLVPASEIIHDRMNCLFHPLVGVSAIYACGLAAVQGLAIQKNSARFFNNMSRPSGILTAPGAISESTAKELKDNWQSNYSGENFGRTAVLGDGLSYERISATAEEAQLVEQLKVTAEIVCSTFHVPPFKIGLGNVLNYQNPEVLNQVYYSDGLQSNIEQMEAVLDEGLGLLTPVEGRVLGVEMDTDALLRMDRASQMKSLTDGVGGGVLTPNEARRTLDRMPVEGGDTIYLQQQYYSLEALAKRDAQQDPFGSASSQANEDIEDTEDEDAEEESEDSKFLALVIDEFKSLAKAS